MPRVTITVPEKNAQPYRFQLDRQSVTLGRTSDNDIAIDSGSVSIRHAEMQRVHGGYVLRDLDSTNGIKHNDERSAEIPLQNGMSLKLGDVSFDFTLTEEEQQLLAQEGKPSGGPQVLWEPEKSATRLPPLRDLPPRPMAMVKEPEEAEEPEETTHGISVKLLVILLTLAAFGIGMAIRFQKDTGGTLMDALKNKHQTPSAPAAPTPHAAHP